MLLRPNVTETKCYLDQMLLDKKELDENELEKRELRRKCTRRNDTEPIGLSPRLKNAEVILEKTYFFCMQILYQAYTIF